MCLFTRVLKRKVSHCCEPFVTHCTWITVCLDHIWMTTASINISFSSRVHGMSCGDICSRINNITTSWMTKWSAILTTNRPNKMCNLFKYLKCHQLPFVIHVMWITATMTAARIACDSGPTCLPLTWAATAHAIWCTSMIDGLWQWQLLLTANIQQCWLS